MGILLGGVIIGLVLGWLYFRGGGAEKPASAENHERELRAILDEVRELRLEIDILKVNPTIGSAVKATLDFAHAQPDFERSGYNVLARPGKVPATAYNVAVIPGKVPGGDDRA